jgi:hypothetical protein
MADEHAEAVSKARVLFMGGLIGALAGVGTAYLLLQRAEEQGKPIRWGIGEGVRLGLLVLGLMRKAARLGE